MEHTDGPNTRGLGRLMATFAMVGPCFLMIGGFAEPVMALPLPSTIAPAVSGAVPLFDAPQSTAHGFTVHVTNYSEEYVWSVKTDAGKVEKGEPRDATLPLTVTGLQPGQSATVEVTAEMPGLDPSSAIVIGSALASTGQTQKGSASERLTFSGQSSRLTANANLVLQRLVARVPDGAKVTRVSIAVTAPRHATAAQQVLARSRASAISRALHARNITPSASITTPPGAKPGIATIALTYRQ